MQKALNRGDAFPELSVDTVGGKALIVPGDLDHNRNVLLFYRGSW